MDVDFRYVNTSGKSFQSANAPNSSQFSQTKNQKIYNIASRFGFNKNYHGTSASNFSNANSASGHNDHGHLGFGN